MPTANPNEPTRPTRRKPELLAPAGGWEQLTYAIRFGADAVYLATDRFGMRQRAENFSLEDIPQVVAYAHERGVRVHVTCNTLMHEPDFDVLPDYLRALAKAKVDAVLISRYRLPARLRPVSRFT